MVKRKNLFENIKSIVAKIPSGKVSTYGQIASLACIRDARIVGWALCKNHDPSVPCHRVLRKDGSIVENYAFGDWTFERRKLLREGITFLKERQVNIKKHLWDGKV